MREEIYGAFGLLIKRHGFLATQRGLTTLASAAILIRQSGEEPTRQAYQDFWKTSERTSYRDFAAWSKISGGADLAVAARDVVAAYAYQDLESASPAVFAFDLVGFVPGQ